MGTSLSISDQLNTIFTREVTFRRLRLNDKRKADFYSELKILFSSGVDIYSSLSLVSSQYENSKLEPIFKTILDHVLKGDNLSNAMRRSGFFSEYECQSIYIGEETGRIEIVLDELSYYFQGRVQQARQIISVLTYPAIVCITAGVVVLFMLRFVVPMFLDVFKRFGSELPYLTRLIIDLSEFIGAILVPAILILSIVGFWVYVNRKKAWYRKYSSGLLLNVPVVKEIIKGIYISRFAKSMSLLLSAKVPLDKTLLMVSGMIEFYPLERALSVIIQNVESGGSLNGAMAEHSFFNRKFIALVKVGEEVNQLEGIFARIASQADSEVKQKIGMFNSLLEPLLIIGLGFIIAIILVAMYLPLFNLGNSIGF